ncbi:DUF1428 domain-containing protein [Thalassotalea fusca]
MTDYIDGFAFPISSNNIDDYKILSEKIACIWIEYGALEYREYIGDDMQIQGTRNFTETLDKANDEVVIFGWVKFESRASRDLIHEQVASDPRIVALMSKHDTGFDAARMACAGLKSLVSVISDN